MATRRGSICFACLAGAALALASTFVAPGRTAADAPAGGEVSPLGYVEMPQATDGSYTLGSGVGSGRHWGRPETIRFLVFAAKEWARRHPDKPRFSIGDISKPDGSEFPPHKTHRDGLCIDLVTRPKNVCHVSYADQDLTIEMARLFVELGAKKIYYNHERVIEAVKEVEALEKHDDHFHIIVDPARVPKDLGPLLVAASPLKGTAAGPAPVGASGFGRPGARAPKVVEDEAGGRSCEGLRLEWDYLGDAKGFQKSYRVEVQALGAGGAALAPTDSGEQKGSRTWHVVEGAFADGQRLRWRAVIAAEDGSSVDTGWQDLLVDLRGPKAAAKAPAAGAKTAAQPTFQWTYEDPSRQREARVEVRRARARTGLALDPVRGPALELKAPAPLPKGALEWRVVATDAAGNEGTSPWTPFEVE